MRLYRDITEGELHTKLRICVRKSKWQPRHSERSALLYKKLKFYVRPALIVSNCRAFLEAYSTFSRQIPAESVFQDLPHIRYFHAKFPPEVYFVTFRIFAIFRQSSACSILRKIPHIRYFTPDSRLRFYRNFIMCRFTQIFCNFFSDYFYLARYLLYI